LTADRISHVFLGLPLLKLSLSLWTAARLWARREILGWTLTLGQVRHTHTHTHTHAAFRMPAVILLGKLLKALSPQSLYCPWA